MRSPRGMFVAAVCLLFLVQLEWPRNKSVYEAYSTLLTSFFCGEALFSLVFEYEDGSIVVCMER